MRSPQWFGAFWSSCKNRMAREESGPTDAENATVTAVFLFEVVTGARAVCSLLHPCVRLLSFYFIFCCLYVTLSLFSLLRLDSHLSLATGDLI